MSSFYFNFAMLRCCVLQKITGIKDKSFEVTDRIVINLINEIII